jgi:hypothetical protein
MVAMASFKTFPISFEELVPYGPGFFVDVETRIDLPTPNNPTHIMRALQRPYHLSANESLHSAAI